MFTYCYKTKGIHLFIILVSDIMNWCDVDITWILHLYIVCNESAQRSVESNKSLDSNSKEFQWSSWRRHMCFPRPAQSNTFLRGTFGQRQDSMKTTRKEYRNITSSSKSALHDKATRHPCLSEFQRIRDHIEPWRYRSLLSLNGPARWNDLKRGLWH